MSNLEFAIGNRVVCISGNPDRCKKEGFEYPRVGCIYTIRNFGEAKSGLCLRFEEIRLPTGHYNQGFVEPCFGVKHFRPVRKTSIDCFTKLLEKQPELVGGDA